MRRHRSPFSLKPVWILCPYKVSFLFSILNSLLGCSEMSDRINCESIWLNLFFVKKTRRVIQFLYRIIDVSWLVIGYLICYRVIDNFFIVAVFRSWIKVLILMYDAHSYTPYTQICMCLHIYMCENTITSFTVYR